LIPSFEEEARLIIDARRLRGMKSLKKTNVAKRLREYSAIMLPLMIKALRKAVIIGLAMDSRAFGAHPKRTWLNEAKMKPIDFTVLAVGIAYAAGAMTANYILNAVE
jgi:energy-coupling factor transporter transmembrane protein EcfT